MKNSVKLSDLKNDDMLLVGEVAIDITKEGI